MRRVLVGLALLTVGLCADLSAQRPLNHDAYEIWRSIDDEVLSRDGGWVAYALTLERGDPELRVRSTGDDREYVVARGREPVFSADSRYVVFAIKPAVDSVRALKRVGKKGDALPKDSLGIMDLATGEVVRVARVKSYRLPEDAGTWVAYHLERPRERPDTTAADTAAAEPDSAAPEPKKASDIGTVLVLRSLATGDEQRYEHVTDYRFANNGSRLAMTLSSRLGEEDGVVVVSLGDAVDRLRIAEGRGTYRSPRFDEAGQQVAFLTDRDEIEEEHPRFALYRWRAGIAEALVEAEYGSRGLPDGWTVSEHRAPEFSANGERLYFGSAPWVEPAPEDSTLEEDLIAVDVWHWRDPALQPQQLLEANRERRRTYLAVVDLERNRIVQLANRDLPTVNVPRDGDADLALGESSLPYDLLSSWDSPGYRDYYLVDVRDGSRTLVLERAQGRAVLSPDGRYLAWWDNKELAFFARATDGGEAVNVSARVPHALHNEDHDWPYPPNPYGAAGWTADGRWMLVYDRHDVWALDPRGRTAPRSVTDGVGRQENLRFRYVQLDTDEEDIPTDVPMLLSAFHYANKQDGFYHDRVNGDGRPQQLVFMERNFNTPRRAADADVLLFTRQSITEFPDLWVADADFDNARQLSDANPQQSEYRWATAELVEWTSTNGVRLQGLLYKPDDFDASQQYPMMVYFYERNSNNLYNHYPPYAHRSVIRPTFYASRGYIVFIPDIVYRDGYPGQSAMDAVMPGIHEVLRLGFVDEHRIGVQGHSWGGYQIAFMVTRTNMFRAAAAGAPVANMTSAYGGIRWGSGRSRMFQYERTQSRLGHSLWEAPMRYIENSPVFWADRIETPVLILHNDQDGAVPWEQGIEFFVALRRLEKSAWLINYNGEPHWPLPFPKRRDWNIRLQQYFDHYLMDAPAPRWMVEGIPATEKGKTMGLELVETDGGR